MRRAKTEKCRPPTDGGPPSCYSIAIPSKTTVEFVIVTAPAIEPQVPVRVSMAQFHPP